MISTVIATFAHDLGHTLLGVPYVGGFLDQLIGFFLSIPTWIFSVIGL
ncbi:hypothetical protein ACFL1X_05185 [Candidatus Hydrogenedentota bacterium]